ncbi:hypothetical protein B0H11DRAFT_1759581 [Mycena galericulata]|nr:hypothetical protein B0H11DRAFT_1759581 [Mycena galericulata]
MKILINGGGIAGFSLAIFLLRSSSSSIRTGTGITYDITVVERAAALRASGQQIDLRSQGVAVVRKMGLLAAMKEKVIAEDGIAIVDGSGKIRAVVDAAGKLQGASGVEPGKAKGSHNISTDYELMRGDVVEVLYQGSLAEAEKAKTTAQEGVATGYGQGVQVAFSDGTSATFDLVVGADGQSSRTRRLAWGQAVSDAAFHFLGTYVSLFTIPRTSEDDKTARGLLLPGRRFVLTRSGDRPSDELRAAFDASAVAASSAEAPREDVEEEKKKLVARLFEDEGGKGGEDWGKRFVRRVVEGMMASDDFYATKIGQVKLDSWSKGGRVVLLGDAGYCPAYATGMGTTCAMVGAYFLAGELARHCGQQKKAHASNGVPAALEAYERAFRPRVVEMQKLPGGDGLIETGWGIKLLLFSLRIVTALKIDRLASMLSPSEKPAWQIPEYPELNLESES